MWKFYYYWRCSPKNFYGVTPNQSRNLFDKSAKEKLWFQPDFVFNVRITEHKRMQVSARKASDCLLHTPCILQLYHWFYIMLLLRQVTTLTPEHRKLAWWIIILRHLLPVVVDKSEKWVYAPKEIYFSDYRKIIQDLVICRYVLVVYFILSL